MCDIQMNPTGDFELETVEHISKKVSQADRNTKITPVAAQALAPMQGLCVEKPGSRHLGRDLSIIGAHFWQLSELSTSDSEAPIPKP